MGDLPVEEVLYAAPLKYLLVVLRADCWAPQQREAALAALRPSAAQLAAAYTGEQLVGVILTVQGACMRLGLPGPGGGDDW